MHIRFYEDPVVKCTSAGPLRPINLLLRLLPLVFEAIGMVLDLV